MWDYPNPDHVHKGLTLQEYIDTIYTVDYDRIVLCCQTEFEFFRFFKYNDIVKAANSKNLTITAIVGVQHEFLHYPDYIYVPNNLEIICWDTVFFRETIEQLLHPTNLSIRKNINKIEDVLIDVRANVDYRYHFVYLNGKAHDHRTQLLDHMSKHDLLQYSAYSWHNEFISLPEHRYNFQWYDGRESTLDEQFVSKRDQGFLPRQYYESFFQVVPETSITIPFITEKTVVPLIVGKPFFIAGSPGINQKLKNLGFELYDELFDYEFDKMEKTLDRYEYICGMIKNITDLPLSELNTLRNKVSEKILHNRSRVIEIAYNNDLLPELAKEIIETYEKTEKVLDYHMIQTHNRLRDLKEKLYNREYIKHKKTDSAI